MLCPFNGIHKHYLLNMIVVVIYTRWSTFTHLTHSGLYNQYDPPPHPPPPHSPLSLMSSQTLTVMTGLSSQGNTAGFLKGSIRPPLNKKLFPINRCFSMFFFFFFFKKAYSPIYFLYILVDTKMKSRKNIPALTTGFFLGHPVDRKRFFT